VSLRGGERDARAVCKHRSPYEVVAVLAGDPTEVLERRQASTQWASTSSRISLERKGPEIPKASEAT
jgi:hypothetical protein